jgi:hypothetical protein
MSVDEVALMRGRPKGGHELIRLVVSLRPDQVSFLRQVSREDAIPVTVLIRQALDDWIGTDRG